jgi:nucleoside phosphorylase
MTRRAEVLLVAVTARELHAILTAFESNSGTPAKPKTVNGRLYHDLGTVNGGRVFLALSEMGTGGVGGAQESVRIAVEDVQPDAVIMCGIAFGVDESKQQIGDVLVSTQLRPYELQRVGKNGEIVYRGDKPHAAPRLINWCTGAGIYWEGAKLRFGSVLTGDKLIDDVDYRDSLKRLEPETVGGEMEGAGLYVACQNAKVDWILVKAICDWADGDKNNPQKDARQELAAKNAASFVLHVLKTIDFSERPIAVPVVAPAVVAAPASTQRGNGSDIADLITDWAQLEYVLKTKFRRAMDKNLAWPGEFEPLVFKEDALYSQILGRLDPSEPSAVDVRLALQSLRTLEDTSSWSLQRDALMARVARHQSGRAR